VVWTATAYSVPPALAAVLSVGVAILAWQNRSKPTARPLAALTVALAGWAACYAVQIGYTTVAAELFWLKLGLSIGAAVPALWFLLTFRYAGLLEQVPSVVKAAIVVEPGLFALVLWSNPTFGLAWTNPSMPTTGAPVVVFEFGVGYLVHITTAYAVIGAGVAALGWVALSGAILHRLQASVMAAGAIVPSILNIAFTLGISPIPGLDLTTFAFSVTGVLFALALFEFDLFEVAPAARKNWIAQLGDGVVAVDADGAVIDTNETARRVLDPPPTVGDPIVDGLPAPTIRAAEGSVVEAHVDDERRFFDVHVEELVDLHGHHAGSVVGLRDVTARETYRRRVAVADRVLRHNFRNETLVIGGQAEYLADELDGEYADVAETIQSHTASLSRLSEQVRDVSTTVEGRSSTQPVELSALVSSVIAGLDTDSVTVRVDLPEQLWVEGVSPDIVETGVRNVVENAIEHNDAAHPRVEITSREAGETLSLIHI